MKVQGVIDAACRQLGFEPTAAESADAMEALNLMLMTWALSPSGLHVATREAFSLAASTTEYTMGDGEDFDTPILPVRILNVFTRTDGMDYPIQTYFSMDEYAAISHKATEGRPSVVYFERTSVDLNTLLFWPTPDDAYPVHIWSHKPLAVYDDLTDDLGLPLEYEPAIKWNLAIDLAGEFGKEIPQQVVLRADQTLHDLKRLYSHPVPALNTNIFSRKRFDITAG